MRWRIGVKHLDCRETEALWRIYRELGVGTEMVNSCRDLACGNLDWVGGVRYNDARRPSHESRLNVNSASRVYAVQYCRRTSPRVDERVSSASVGGQLLVRFKSNDIAGRLQVTRSP